MEYLIGIIIGSLLGLTGAGGSLVAVPLFILLLQMAPAEAMGIALGSVAASAFAGVVRQASHVLWFPGLILSMSGILSAPFGRKVAFALSDATLAASFCLLTFSIAAYLWRQAANNPETTRIVRATTEIVKPTMSLHFCADTDLRQYRLSQRCFYGLLGGGLVIGFLSGLFGVGGGFLIVPYLLFLGHISLRSAIATSLFIIVLISLSGFISYLSFSQSIDLPLLLKIIGSGIIGMLVAQQCSSLVIGVYLQKIIAVILVILSVFMLIKTI